jgi:hypothetical protein
MAHKRLKIVNVHLRIPGDLHAKIAKAAKASNNPINTEMKLRLAGSFAESDRLAQTEQQTRENAEFNAALKQRLAAAKPHKPAMATVEEIENRLAALEEQAKREAAQHERRYVAIEELLQQIKQVKVDA